MCPLPNEALSHSAQISSQQIIQQFDSAFYQDRTQEFEVLTLYNNGNFFADAEIPPEAREHIFQSLSRSQVKTLIVESLPQFITKRELDIAKKNLSHCKLMVAIGLQSSNDVIRESAINTICTKYHFEQSVALLEKYGYKPLVFLMIKPPFLTESEAIEDAVSSVNYLQSLGLNEAILCPTKVDEATIVNLLFQRKQYAPPWLWTIIEILKQIHVGKTNHPARIATSLLDSNRQTTSLTAKNCPKCTARAIQALEEFNMTKNLKLLDSVKCDCYSIYKEQIAKENQQYGSIPIKKRVSNFITSYYSK